MSWSSCRSETETYSGRNIYDKESDRWKIDKWKSLLSKKFVNNAIYLFYIARSLNPRRLRHRKLICYSSYQCLSIHLSLTIPLSPFLSRCFYLSVPIFHSLFIFHFLFLSLSLSFSIYLHIYFSTFSTYLSLSIYLCYSGSRQSRQYA